MPFWNELMTAFDKYGPQTVFAAIGVLIAIWVVRLGMRILERMSTTSANRAQTQDGLDKDQMRLTLKMAELNEVSQTRLANLQEGMIKEQQNNQEVIHRLTQELTVAVLNINKCLKQLESLTARITHWEARTTDWDARLGLYLRTQTDLTEVFAQINNTLNTLLAHFSPKDTSS